MIFTYPAVLTPHKNGKGYHVTFPDLQCYEVDGPDLGDAVEHTRETTYNWLYLEIGEKAFGLPPQTHMEGIRLEEREFLKHIMVIIRLLPDSD